jgi:rubrerythrin
MGYPEYPSWKEKRKLRRYKCRVCGRVFKDWYLSEQERICPTCARQEVKNAN